jgi:hypothetical protein
MDLKNYKGQILTTDEYAEGKNQIIKDIHDLESIALKTGKDYLLLKWGTIKSFGLKSDNGKKLLERYNKIGSCISVMLQKDTDEQKKILCEMIDECNGCIQEDWGGKYLTKKGAKKYVLDYK